jgi:peroxiredoxin
MKTGPAVGAAIPKFEALDQNGRRQTFETLRGPKGLALPFVRSADWWPYCKAQLVELEGKREEFRQRGLAVASLSYDSAALLREFAERKGIKYPMLSDPESNVIRDFGILNDTIPPGAPFYGIPFPGTYVVDEHGIVRAKYFEADYRERFSAANVLVREFGAEGGGVRTVETRHLKLTYWASDTSVSAGNRVVLALDVELKPGMHVYAPGVQDYIPIDWKIADSKAWHTHPAAYPSSKRLHLAVIGETVPVYEGRFRITRDVTIGQPQEFGALLDSSHALAIAGSFRYQACDDKECYLPVTIPLGWAFRIESLDRERAPAELQRGRQP